MKFPVIPKLHAAVIPALFQAVAGFFFMVYGSAYFWQAKNSPGGGGDLCSPPPGAFFTAPPVCVVSPMDIVTGLVLLHAGVFSAGVIHMLVASPLPCSAVSTITPPVAFASVALQMFTFLWTFIDACVAASQVAGGSGGTGGLGFGEWCLRIAFLCFPISVLLAYSTKDVAEKMPDISQSSGNGLDTSLLGSGGAPRFDPQTGQPLPVTQQAQIPMFDPRTGLPINHNASPAPAPEPALPAPAPALAPHASGYEGLNNVATTYVAPPQQQAISKTVTPRWA
jgi:hypothetical protein